MPTNEHPILMSSEMVRAILTCAKCGTITIEILCPKCGSTERLKTQTRRIIKNPPRLEGMMLKGEEANWCPYGKVGDRLWVRERAKLIEPDGGCGWNNQYKGRFRYEADKTETDWMPYPERLSILDCGYCVPNGCYKEIARIWLEITGIRVERVQEINEQGAEAEGVTKMHLDDLGQTWKTYVRGFQSLWDSLNAKRGYGWEKNPWVWVIEFKRAQEMP